MVGVGVFYRIEECDGSRVDSDVWIWFIGGFRGRIRCLGVAFSDGNRG